MTVSGLGLNEKKAQSQGKHRKVNDVFTGKKKEL